MGSFLCSPVPRLHSHVRGTQREDLRSLLSSPHPEDMLTPAHLRIKLPDVEAI